ncbi:hypothetical protein ACFW1M_22800, partial [Streptomyces inhibens]|uniref:hypothetical protein n=1 Tax=Streptomyces inhibens TaxID=2293571 RepID=UPI00369F307A
RAAAGKRAAPQHPAPPAGHPAPPGPPPPRAHPAPPPPTAGPHGEDTPASATTDDDDWAAMTAGLISDDADDWSALVSNLTDPASSSADA